MEAILFVGHGSKDPEGNEDLIKFTDKVVKIINEQVQVPIKETCFLELTTPTIAEGIAKCIARGASKIALVPIILFSAGHAKLDIPMAIDQGKNSYPNVEFTYGRPIIIHENILTILSDSLEEQGFVSGDKRRDDAAILVVGRGSSDPDANSEFFKVVRYFWEKTSTRWVEPAFMGITEPTFDEGIERCISTGAKEIYILPYFLFTGVLIKRMAGVVDSYREKYPNVIFKLGNPFGIHELLVDVIKERGLEALSGNTALNCDMCPYRLGEEVSNHHHHHHHHDHDHHHQED